MSEQAVGTGRPMGERGKRIERLTNQALKAAGYGNDYYAVAWDLDEELPHARIIPTLHTGVYYVVRLERDDDDVWAVELDTSLEDESDTMLASVFGAAYAAAAVVAEIARARAICAISTDDLVWETEGRRQEIEAGWGAVEASMIDNDPGPDPHAPDCGPPFYCANGCGYEVAYANTFCGECGCEDDSSCW